MVIKPYLLAPSPTSLTEIADDDIKPLFQKLVGSLIYLEICTCPDIAYAAMALGQFNTNPTCAHLAAVRGRHTHLTQNLMGQDKANKGRGLLMKRYVIYHTT